MSRVVINILEEETLPSFILPLELNPELVIFISNASESLKIARVSALLLEKFSIKTRIQPIASFEIKSLLNILSLLKQEFENARLYLNLSGTHGYLSFPAFDWATKNSVEILLAYTTNQFLCFSNDKTWELLPVKIRVSMEDFLKIHGFEIVTKQNEFNPERIQCLKSILNLPQKHFEKFKKGCKSNEMNSVEELRNFCKCLEEKGNFKSENDIDRYLSGLWLEEYLFAIAYDIFEEAYYRVTIKDYEHTGVLNELDFMGMFNNQLYVISTKTGRVFKQHLSELSILRNSLSQDFAHAGFVSSQILTENFKNRARLYKIDVADFNDLRNLKFKIISWLK